MIDTIAQSDYIGAARTDKGVHAVNNVLSIVVNSNLSVEEINAGKVENERDFVSMMNRHLPHDIVVTSWAPVAMDFSARFSVRISSSHFTVITSIKTVFYAILICIFPTNCGKTVNQ